MVRDRADIRRGAAPPNDGRVSSGLPPLPGRDFFVPRAVSAGRGPL